MEPIIDSRLAVARKLRALRRPVQGADFLGVRVAEDLAERLAVTARRFPRAGVLFGAAGHGAAALMRSGKVDEIVRVEADVELLNGAPGVAAPPETVPFPPGTMDLLVSLLAIHEMNDVPGFLVQARRALKPDGLFLAALPGADTLNELRLSLAAAEGELASGASPRVLPFIDVRDAGALLQRAGFALPVADSETVTVCYRDLFALMADLRAMGAASALAARSRRPATRSLFGRAAEIYAERFSDPDGRIRATFSIVWMSGWAPDPSQRKPLARGSARARLSDALRQAESGLGEDGE